MDFQNQPRSTPDSGVPRLFGRSLALFANFFFIILAYYQIKSASRSLLIEYGGMEWFPYAWVFSALALIVFIGFYHVLVERYSRVRIVFGSLLAFSLLLVAFHGVLNHQDTASAMAFYIFVDIFSVVLVEQFWSLSNSVNDTDQGKRSYWFVGTGGLLGGVVGGVLASALIEYTPMQTSDLLLSCAGILMLTLCINFAMWRAGMYEEVQTHSPEFGTGVDWRVLVKSRYLRLIALVLCFSQLAQPLVEYQFMSAIDVAFGDLDSRTQFISSFFSKMGVISIGVNLVLTPLIHRHLGIVVGLMVQPVLLSICSLGFFVQPTLLMAQIMKISDRGLSYSINRASKELLYIPVDPVHTYQAKAWIDMLGYRLFKVLGSGLILLATQWLPVRAGVTELTWLTVTVCGLWIATIFVLGQEYRTISVTA